MKTDSRNGEPAIYLEVVGCSLILKGGVLMSSHSAKT